MNIEERLVGKTITNVEVDGYEMTLVFDDGAIFNYFASDGGYSCYGFDDENEED